MSLNDIAGQRHQQPDGGMSNSTAWLQLVGGSARTSPPVSRRALKHMQVLRLDMLSATSAGLEACTMSIANGNASITLLMGTFAHTTYGDNSMITN